MGRTENHERLNNGFGRFTEQLAEHGEDEDEDVYRVRIVPIGEGDITHGMSGEPTVWDREPLEQAVDDGVFDDAKLLKGRPDDGHKELTDQADPDEIIGGVEEWTYEPGVGPVGKGLVIDEHLAKLIEHDLVDVSADLLRVLGGYDEEREVNTVDEIIGVPYITVLDYGSARSNTIEPETAEALGMHPDEMGVDTEASEEQLSSELFTLRFNTFGDMIGDEFLDNAVENLESIDGITAARSSSNDNPELLAVIDRDAIASLDDLNDNIIDALEDTPFEVHDDFDWVQQVAWEGLSGEPEEADVQTTGDGGEQTSDEPAEPGAGSSDPTQNMSEELQEQLAEVRTERDRLENETDDLEEQLSDTEETLSNKEDEIEQLSGKIDELEEEISPFQEMLAGIVAQDSMLDADSVADRYDISEMTEMLAANSETDEDEDVSPVDVVKEQLSESPAPRGEGGGEEDTVEQLSGDALAEANSMARDVMGADDVMAAAEEQLSPRDYAVEYLGTDPADCNTTAEFRRKVEDDGGDA